MEWNPVPVKDSETLGKAWQKINLSGPRSPVLEQRFVLPLLREFGTGRETAVVYGDPDDPVAAALVGRKRGGFWETFQPSQAPLGSWVQRGDYPVGELLAALLDSLPGFSVGVGITQQDPGLLERPAPQGRLRTLDYIETARVTVEGAFDDYWAARGKNLRHNLKRQRNRLRREGAVTRLETITDPKHVEQAVQGYGELESAGWKAKEGTAVGTDNSQGRFYRKVLEDFCETGDGVVYRYWYDDKPVAMDLCVAGNGTLVILKTAYDESQTTSSPAFLMREEQFSHIFGAGKYKRIEFYGRVMDWHRKWAHEVRTMYHLNYYRWSVIPWIGRIGAGLR